MIRGADLQGKRVVTESGKRLGRVAELHIREGQVTTLVVGAHGLLQRFLADRKGRTVRWDAVLKLTPKEIVVRD